MVPLFCYDIKYLIIGSNLFVPPTFTAATHNDLYMFKTGGLSLCFCKASFLVKCLYQEGIKNSYLLLSWSHRPGISLNLKYVCMKTCINLWHHCFASNRPAWEWKRYSWLREGPIKDGGGLSGDSVWGNEDEGPGGRDGVKGGCGRGEGKSETRSLILPLHCWCELRQRRKSAGTWDVA